MSFFQKLQTVLFLIISTIGCAQVPVERPGIENPEFDRKLTRLLPFKTPLIGVEELHQNYARYQLLDARAPEEYATSHLPGATFLGYGGDFDETVLKDLDKQKPLVVYCSVGYRSDKVGERLQELGFTDVRNLYGSLFEWANRGYELEDASGKKTRRVHTYNAKWGRWMTHEGFEKVY